MNVLKHYNKLITTRVYTASALFIFLIAIIYIIFLEYYNLKSLQKQYKINAHKELNVITKTLELTFEYTNYINSTIGKQIAQQPKNFQAIHTLLSNPKYLQYKNLLYFSWSLFDWVDNKNYQRVNSKVGIRRPPPDMSVREYTYLAPQYPWTLQFAKPTLGNPSKKFVIPAGTGITDEDGRYLGVVVVGITVEDLITQITQFITHTNVEFILEGTDGATYLKHGNNTNYLAEGLLTNYPFVLKVGFHNGTIYKAFLNKLYYDLRKIILGMVMLAVILFYFGKTLKRKDMINEKQNISMLSSINLSKKQISLMREQIDNTIKNVNHNMTKIENSGELSDNQKENMYSMIAVLRSIKDSLFSTIKANTKPVVLEEVINTALELQSVKMLETNLKVKLESQKQYTVKVDEVKFITLLNFIVSYVISSGGNNLNIVIKEISNNNINIIFNNSYIKGDGITEHKTNDGISFFQIRNILLAHHIEMEFRNNEVIITHLVTYQI